MNERERLEYLMRCYNLTPSLFADKAGIQRASVSHILSGRNKISIDIVTRINAAFPEASFEWLIKGTGVPPKQQSVAEEPEAPTLFAEPEPVVAEVEVKKPLQQPKNVQVKVLPPVQPPKQQRRSVSVRNTNPDKYIKEIRVFYSDGTYEIFTPEK